MPHLILEYTANVEEPPDLDRVLIELNRALIELDMFEPGDVKSRARRVDAFAVGAEEPASFVALRIEVLEGRSDEEKGRIADAAFGVLSDRFAAALDSGRCNLTVQIADIHRASYRRRRQGG